MDATFAENEMNSGFTRFMGLKRCTRVARAINAIMEHEIALGNKPTFWCSASDGSVTIRIYPTGLSGKSRRNTTSVNVAPGGSGMCGDSGA